MKQIVLFCSLLCFMVLFYGNASSYTYTIVDNSDNSYFGQYNLSGNSTTFKIKIKEDNNSDFKDNTDNVITLIAPLGYSFNCNTAPTLTPSGSINGSYDIDTLFFLNPTPTGAYVDSIKIKYAYKSTSNHTDEIVVSDLKIAPNSSHTAKGSIGRITVRVGGVEEVLATPQFNLLIERYTNITGTKVIPFGNSLDSVNININELLGANYGFWKSQNDAFGTLKEDHIKITAPYHIKIINSGIVSNISNEVIDFSTFLSPANVIDISFLTNDTKARDMITIPKLVFASDTNYTGGNNDGTLKVQYKHPMTGSWENIPLASGNSELIIKHNTPQITKFITDTTKIYCEHGSDITFDITIKEPNAGSKPYNTYDKICLVDQNNQVIDFLSASKVNSFITSQVSTVKFTTDKLTRKHTSVKALLINNNPAGAQTMSLS